MRTFIPCALILSAVLPGAAIAADPSRGLESLRQPVVTNGVAHVPGCPDWSDNKAHPSPFESMSSNYGCATNSNLAAMIADPADLLQGRVATDGGGEVATRAIKSYRETPPSGKGGQVEKVSAKGGN
jgi:pilus assembly protein CpaD